MDPSLILSVIHTITIGTMLNFNGGNNGYGLKYVTCKPTFTLNLFQVITFTFQNNMTKYTEFTVNKNAFCFIKMIFATWIETVRIVQIFLHFVS